MGKVKHTPGPWYVNTDSIDISLKQIGVHPSSEVIQRSNCIGIRHNGTSAGVATATANARLIAAAPDMLESLIEVLSCIDQHTDDAVLGPIIGNAKSAIAKAKGGA